MEVAIESNERVASEACITLRGTSSCIASGALNSAVRFRNAREQMGLDVTHIA
jgi:hypothetical protein